MTDTQLPISHGSKGSCCRTTGGKSGSFLPWLSVPLRLSLGGLFLIAAYNKLFIMNGPQLFSNSINAFKVFDPRSQETLVQLATFVTPWIELVAGVALVLGVWTRAAAGVLGVLLIGFIGLIARILSMGEAPECGCFGKISPFCPVKLSSCNLIQNGIMLAAAITIMACRKHVLALENLFCKRGCCGGKA